MSEYQKLLQKSAEGKLTKSESVRYQQLQREVQEADARQKLADAVKHLHELETKRIGIEKEISHWMSYVIYAGAVLAPKQDAKKKGAKR